jgi:hypothetical protein
MPSGACWANIKVDAAKVRTRRAIAFMVSSLKSAISNWHLAISQQQQQNLSQINRPAEQSCRHVIAIDLLTGNRLGENLTFHHERELEFVHLQRQWENRFNRD